MGEFVPNASNGIDTYCIREPVGVCAGICPFNFPAIIPLWVCVQSFRGSFIWIFIFISNIVLSLYTTTIYLFFFMLWYFFLLCLSFNHFSWRLVCSFCLCRYCKFSIKLVCNTLYVVFYTICLHILEKRNEKETYILNCWTILQMFPIAVACGNTFVLKPCEKNPGDCQPF